MFTLTCVIVVCLIVVNLLVIFSQAKGDAHVETPYLQQPFSHLAMLAQYQCRSGTPLGRAVQAVSANTITSVPRTVTGGRKFSGNFKFGVGMVEGRVQIEWGWSFGSGSIIF